MATIPGAQGTDNGPTTPGRPPSSPGRPPASVGAWARPNWRRGAPTVLVATSTARGPTRPSTTSALPCRYRQHPGGVTLTSPTPTPWPTWSDGSPPTTTGGLPVQQRRHRGGRRGQPADPGPLAPGHRRQPPRCRPRGVGRLSGDDRARARSHRHTASLSGLLRAPARPYSTTKHAVVGLSVGVAVEAANHGVRVSVLFPV